MKLIYFGLHSISLLHWHTCHDHHRHHRHRHIFTFSSILNKSSPPTPSIVNENQEDDLQPEDFGLGSSVRKTLWCKVDCIDLMIDDFDVKLMNTFASNDVLRWEACPTCLERLTPTKKRQQGWVYFSLPSPQSPTEFTQLVNCFFSQISQLYCITSSSCFCP